MSYFHWGNCWTVSRLQTFVPTSLDCCSLISILESPPSLISKICWSSCSLLLRLEKTCPYNFLYKYVFLQIAFDFLHVSLRGSLVARHPNPRGSEAQRSGQAPAVVDATGSHAQHGWAEEVQTITASVHHLPTPEWHGSVSSKMCPYNLPPGKT